MIDGRGRNIDYLRISLTDRCNLRCVYCMPVHGVESIDHTQVMRFEELLHICRLMAELGVHKFKISGGEPLVRKGAVNFIRELKQLPGVEQVTLTTNGQLLPRDLPALLEAGIDGINISIDTLNAERYRQITRCGEMDDVLMGLDAAYAAGVRPLKTNSVLMRGVNDDELENLAALARDRDISVRFIELMPIGLGRQFEPVSGAEVLARLSARYGEAQPFRGKLGNGPASYYCLPGFRGHIGLIDAVSHGFCNVCNRVRLTSNGWLKLCLHFDLGCDVLGELRRGADDAQLKQLILQTVEQKPEHHTFGTNDAQHVEQKNMNSIGG